MYELMKHESKRLQTFQMDPPWPKNYVDIKKLAKAGFFYAFVDDNVHCAFCQGQVCQWDRDDDPMTEHARHFSTCPFIMGGDVGNIPLGDDPFPGPKRPRPYDVCGIFQNDPDQPNDMFQSQTQFLEAPRNEIRRNIHSESRITSHRMNNNLMTSPNAVSSPINAEFNNQCKICYENHIEVHFIPCGHSLSCINCSQVLENCPYCRSPIERQLRTYII